MFTPMTNKLNQDGEEEAASVFVKRFPKWFRVELRFYTKSPKESGLWGNSKISEIKTNQPNTKLW